MARLVLEPLTFREDLLAGLTAAYGRYVARLPGASGVVRADGVLEGKVSLVIGGGSGHYPAFAGLVGPGLADAAVVGDVFTAPSAEQAHRVAAAVDGGAGVLFSFGNYAGDVLHFGIAQERLRSEGVDCRTVLVTDDVASAPPGEADRRRGIAGGLCVFKVAGAAAAEGASIDEVERLARKASAATRTIGVAFSGCTLPGRREPLFIVEEASYAVGLGIHGEPGIRAMAAVPPAGLAEVLVGELLAERPSGGDGRAVVLLNGLGATKYEELFVLWSHVAPLLADAGVMPVLPEVDELVTSLDMAGCSLTLCWLDDELAALWSAPADTPAFRRGGAGEGRFRRRPPAAGPGERAAAVEAPAASPESARAAGVARRALGAMLAAVEGEEQRLGELDAVAGDGDHGAGMVRGLRAAVAAAGSAPGGLGSLLGAAGRAFADRAGGTSGALWGLLLETVGNAFGDERRPDALAVAEAIRLGAASVSRVGGAQVGDKTMLDALVPFSDSLSAAVAGAPLGVAWAGATRVAVDAAEATARLRPRVGRARPLADRSLGHPDPGAVSVALCLAAVGELVALRPDEGGATGGLAPGGTGGRP